MWEEVIIADMNRECDWCTRGAAFEIVAHWDSFWACTTHDIEMAHDCAEHGVNIIEIADRRK